MFWRRDCDFVQILRKLLKSLHNETLPELTRQKWDFWLLGGHEWIGSTHMRCFTDCGVSLSVIYGPVLCQRVTSWGFYKWNIFQFFLVPVPSFFFKKCLLPSNSKWANVSVPYCCLCSMINNMTLWYFSILLHSVLIYNFQLFWNWRFVFFGVSLCEKMCCCIYLK